VLNFSVDAADGGGSGFQPGSTVKTVTFAEWLNEGHSMNEVVDASRRLYPLNFPWKASCTDLVNFGAYDPSAAGSVLLPNDEPGWYRAMTVREGIAHSINTATFASAAKLDLCGINDMGKAMGLHSAADGSALDWTTTLSSLIGGGKGVSPLTMATAFATFASSGMYCKPIAIESITDYQGKDYPVPTADCSQSIKPEVANAVNYGLQEVLTQGSAYGLGIGTPAAVKTGTTDSSEQTWVIGYTPKLATASWWGWWKEGARRDALNYNYKGKVFPQVDGAYIAGPQWQNYMKQAVSFYPGGTFTAPPANLLANTRGTTTPATPTTPSNPTTPANPPATSAPSAPATTQPQAPDSGKQDKTDDDTPETKAP
jgi:membrane peptidoglycan carboxypeptidase